MYEALFMRCCVLFCPFACSHVCTCTYALPSHERRGALSGRFARILGIFFDWQFWESDVNALPYQDQCIHIVSLKIVIEKLYACVLLVHLCASG